MTNIVKNIMKTAEHSRTETAYMKDNYDSLRAELPQEQFVKVIRIVDEKDELIHTAARRHYRRGLRDGVRLAKLLELNR